MVDEWKTYRLDELCEFINGFAFKSTDYVPPFSDTIEVFRMGYIRRGGGFKEDDSPVFVPRKYGRNLEKFFLQPGDVTIAMTDMKDRVALLGNTAWIRDAGRFVMNQRVGCMRVKRPDLLEPRFLYFYSNWSPHIDYLRSRANSGVQVNLSTSAIKESELTVPPLGEQRAIAAALGALDDKIELNRRINATLETMARALFQSWFVDFDPVRAKLDGRQPPGLDAATAALFPEHFDHSDEMLHPAGWKLKSVYDCAKYINGVAFRDVQFSNDGSGLPVVKIAELKNGLSPQTKFTTHELAAKYKIRDGEILFSWSGSPDTSIDTFVWAGGDGWLNQHIFKVEFYHPEEKLFVYYLLKHLKPTFIEIARDKQTTGLGHVTAQDMKRLNVSFPTKSVLQAFERKVQPIFDRSLATLFESRTLATLRDTLLPKLLSGELKAAG